MTTILFNKPFQVLCQFSPHPSYRTLSDYLSIPNIYPAGRLDADSEGLVLLTDDGGLQHRISHPTKIHVKTYLVQVEGTLQIKNRRMLESPINLGDFVTRPSQVTPIHPPEWLWPRPVPIRQRENIPTDWLTLTISEGKNRQVRRMTAAVGLPTLRLIRIAIGVISLERYPLMPGKWCAVTENDLSTF